MANYEATSPYFKTKFENGSLGSFQIRPVPAEPNDVLYTVEVQYTHRPDLLAHDLYGDRKLWWVFAQRNMDVMKDPVYDLVAGLQIYLPQGDKLQRLLGI
jgi:hypothetical protein